MNFKRITPPDSWFVLWYPDNPDAVPGLRRRPIWPWRIGLLDTQNERIMFLGPIAFVWKWRLTE